MAGPRLSGPDVRSRRRWSFAGSILGEANWTLTVRGRRVAIETKPLELLRQLLLNAGRVISKDQLLDSVWPEVTVVEASLPTAVHKLRLVLHDDQPRRRIIETVPGIGYRLAVPVKVEDLAAAPAIVGTPSRAGDVDTVAIRPRPPAAHKSAGARLFVVSGALAIAFVVIAFGASLSQRVSAKKLAPPEAASTTMGSRPYTRREVFNILRRMDIAGIERMLAAGWDPNATLDDQGNGAVNVVLGRCEWDPGHDQEQMVLAVRTLLDGGAKLEARNVWGDTAYSIAKTPRYCGPRHPVTKMLKALCYNGYKPSGDRCLASYELARRSRPSVGGKRTAAG